MATPGPMRRLLLARSLRLALDAGQSIVQDSSVGTRLATVTGLGEEPRTDGPMLRYVLAATKRARGVHIVGGTPGRTDSRFTRSLATCPFY